MQRSTPLALVLALAALAAILPASASAITLHVHRTVDVVGGVEVREEVGVVKVAPRDDDEDGFANRDDRCDRDAYSAGNEGCTPPPPDPVVYEPIEPSYPEPSYEPSTSGCPSYMSGEASSPDAVNPTSGAAGCFQVIPSTAAAMGAACADVNSTSCAAAICAAQGDDAWVAADPCGYVGRP